MQKKILLIEDNTEIRENMSEILSLADYEVFAAGDGKEGVTIALKELPDLILCDIMMPVLDGYSVLSEIKKTKQISNIPVVMLTALGFELNKELAQNLGAAGYITEPVELAELMQTVSRVLPLSK